VIPSKVSLERLLVNSKRFGKGPTPTLLLTDYGEEGDPDCSLPKYWALIEAKHCNNIAKSREIWNESMTGWRNNKAQAWLEYYTFERCSFSLYITMAAVSSL